ncbi:MAG: iron-sulfur cluster assembly scaffold protein [Steroidobacter sp.]
MSDAAYTDQVVEHFERPRNAGRLATAPDVIGGAAGERAQGARFGLSARIADGRISELRFEVYGCPHCVAAVSWLSERLVGATRVDLQEWSWREVAQALEVPAEKCGRLLILEDAVQSLAESWRAEAYHHAREQ